jgi:hypothetical protein
MRGDACCSPGGATFADLYRRGRPQVSINATDISFGSPFGFLPQTFDVICADLAALPIARAVAASNGFPVLFGPVTLRNYRGLARALAIQGVAVERAGDKIAAANLFLRAARSAAAQDDKTSAVIGSAARCPLAPGKAVGHDAANLLRAIDKSDR